MEGVGSGLTGIAGLDEIRGASPYFELPLFGVGVYAQAEIMALRALNDPQGVVEDDKNRDDTLKLLWLLGGAQVPLLTNSAALGMAFDTESCPLSFAAMTLGKGIVGIKPQKSKS